MRSYTDIRVFSNTKYTSESTLSMEQAKFNNFKLAYEDGNWKPRKLREKWWQIFRPVEHNEIEIKILEYYK